MDRLKVYNINIFVLSLISILNIYTGIIEKMDFIYYVYYVLPFIISLIIYSFFRNYIIDALLFIIASSLSIFISSWGSLTSPIFLCFAFYCLDDKKIIVITCFCTLITIISKMIMDENGTIIRTIMYIIGYSYIILIYYILIHPKKSYNILIDEDKINLEIISFLIQGNRIKEIANKVYLSENAITKRIEKMRVKYNCRNNEQLVYSFTEKGYIRHN